MARRSQRPKPMFDTIKLEISGSFLCTNDVVFVSIKSNDSWRKRRLKIDKKPNGLNQYFPQITIEEHKEKSGWLVHSICVEGSIPKMIYGTNYFEVDESKVDLLFNTILNCFELVGIKGCGLENIENGNVCIIAYCKNFHFPDDFVKPEDFFKSLTHLDVTKMTKNMTKKNWEKATTGYGIKFWSTRRGISFYDKTAQIVNNKQQTAQETEVLSLIEGGSLSRCFRIETTLQNRTAVKQYLASITDKDEQRERKPREVLKDEIAINLLVGVFTKLADPVNTTALEQEIYPLSDFYERAKQEGLNFSEAQLFLAHCFAVQQIGSLQLKNTADSFHKYGRQYRYRDEQKLRKIALRFKPQKLRKVFRSCYKQLQKNEVFTPGYLQGRDEAIFTTIFDKIGINA